jgi:methyltransferase (TIGR00027 family)
VRLLPPQLHTTERPSATAQWTTLDRALELKREPAQRIVTDIYAPVFLTEAYRATLRLLELGKPVLRRAERAEIAGLAAFVLCRHRFIDEHLLAELAGDCEQVLVLGAGYDARAYRFADRIADRPFFEVDLAPLSRRKAAIVASRRDLFGSTQIRRVEIDFQRDALGTRLLAAGFETGLPTFVAWEGVSMYLTRTAVNGTLAAVAELCGAGSVVAMDLWHAIDGAGVADRVRRFGARAIRLIGEPVTFGLSPTEAPEFLRAHGFDVFDLVQSDELAARYATDGRHSEKSVYVLAARLGRENWSA